MSKYWKNQQGEVIVADQEFIERLDEVWEPVIEEQEVWSFEHHQKLKKEHLHTWLDFNLNKIKASCPKNEVATWPAQQAEWCAYYADNTASTPVCDAIAKGRGLSREQFLTKVGVKVQASMELIGQMQGYEDAIKAATTSEELNAVQWQQS